MTQLLLNLLSKKICLIVAHPKIFFKKKFEVLITNCVLNFNMFLGKKNLLQIICIIILSAAYDLSIIFKGI